MCRNTCVERALLAFEDGDIETLRDTLSDDFLFLHGGTPHKHDKNGFLLNADRLHAAIPDWRFDARLDATGTHGTDGVLQVTGTHTGRFDLSHMGLGSLRSTGRTIALPTTRASWRIVDDKITRFRVEGRPGGGLPGVLAQLGVSVPATPPTTWRPRVHDRLTLVRPPGVRRRTAARGDGPCGASPRPVIRPIVQEARCLPG